MEIVLGKTAGFCYGVKNAVSNTEERLKEHKKLSCLGELVHNGEVIRRLENLGLKVIDDLKDSSDKLIIRAHGITKEIYKQAKEMNIELFDYTCPKVLKIHDIASEYADKGYFIFLIGGKNHPESIGTMSFCGNQSYLIETDKFSIEKFEYFIEKIKRKLPEDVELEIKNTICNATKIRQEETENISKVVDCMIIIGGKNSSNTRKLYDISKKNCDNTFIIETKDEIEKQQVCHFDRVGIMAGASTPRESIDEVIKKIV